MFLLGSRQSTRTIVRISLGPSSARWYGCASGALAHDCRFERSLVGIVGGRAVPRVHVESATGGDSRTPSSGGVRPSAEGRPGADLFARSEYSLPDWLPVGPRPKPLPRSNAGAAAPR